MLILSFIYFYKNIYFKVKLYLPFYYKIIIKNFQQKAIEPITLQLCVYNFALIFKNKIEDDRLSLNSYFGKIDEIKATEKSMLLRIDSKDYLIN